jgi:hypothetical protein
MVFGIDDRPDINLRRLLRPLLLVIVALVAAGICILGTVHVFAPALMRV